MTAQLNYSRWPQLNLAQHKLQTDKQNAEGTTFFQIIKVALLSTYFSIISRDLQKILVNFVLHVQI